MGRVKKAAPLRRDRMNRPVRIVLGILCVFFAASAYARAEDDLSTTLLFGLLALFLLFREMLGALPSAWNLLRSLGSALWTQAKKTEKMRHCKCCGGLAVYLVTTCVPRPNAPGPIPDRRNVFVCREHHPNPDIGTRAEELHTYIRGNIHPAATDECVFPHNPY
jgi:hypothetical protein